VVKGVEGVDADFFRPQVQNGGATPRAGSITESEPHTAPKWAAVAAGPSRPAAKIKPRTAPQPVP
jgi:hypothetical protein